MAVGFDFDRRLPATNVYYDIRLRNCFRVRIVYDELLVADVSFSLPIWSGCALVPTGLPPTRLAGERKTWDSAAASCPLATLPPSLSIAPKC